MTCVRGALVWKHAGGATTGPGLPNPIVHATDISAGLGFERDVSSFLASILPYLPVNQFRDVYDSVLADNERVNAFRYKVSTHPTTGEGQSINNGQVLEWLSSVGAYKRLIRIA